MIHLHPGKIAAGLGLGLIAVGTICYWYDPVLFPGFSIFGMPLFHSAVETPSRIYLGLSYGLAIVAGLVLAWIGWEMRRPVPIAWAAFFLLLLGLNCPLQIGFSEPSWLEQFLQARADSLALSGFSNGSNFTLEILAEPLPSAKLTDVEDLYDRWYASIVAMQIGWWFYMTGALLFMIAALGGLPNSVTRRTYLNRAGIVLLLFLAFHGARPVLGELCWNLGQEQERKGNRNAAERYYRDALALDEWNRRIPRVYERLGALAEADQRIHEPEYHLFIGERQVNQNDPNEAMDEFSQAMMARNPDLRRVAGNEYSHVAFNVATSLYKKGSNFGEIPIKGDMVPAQAGLAAFYWQKAAETTASNMAENFMAARAFEDSARYDRATTLLSLARGKTADPMIKSQIFDSQGDVDYLQGDFSEARVNYLKAYSFLNHNKDYWSVRTVKDLADNALNP